MLATEVFNSFQGETTYAGLPRVLARSKECNLRWDQCDAAYAFCGVRSMMAGRLLDELANFVAFGRCDGGELRLRGF